MRWLAVLLIVAASTIYYRVNRQHVKHIGKSISGKVITVTGMRNIAFNRIGQFSNEAKSYVAKNNFNTRYFFFIDMKMASGSKRFLVYDLENDSIVRAGLVAHGSGLGNTGQVTFSNQPGSNCSSLGKYKVGKPYYGKFGLAYKLHGQEATNSNAFKRFVVLHSHACVPDFEIDPFKICTSWGCPTVSPSFLKELKSYIDNSPQPILLWVIN